MSAAIFNGTSVKILKEILKFKSGALIITNDSDNPTSVAKNAPISSLYLRQGTAEVYVKNDNGSSTNWSLIATGSNFANRTLSNLTSPTAINENLTFNKLNPQINTPNVTGSSDAEDLILSGGNSVSGIAGSIILKPGATSAGSTGTIDLDGSSFSSGYSTIVNIKSQGAATGSIIQFLNNRAVPSIIATEDVSDGTTQSAELNVYTGNQLDTNSTQPTGSLTVETGDQGGAGTTAATGSIIISSGDNAGSGNSGDVTIKSGTINSGTRGTVILDGASINVSSKKIINLATPTSANDAANKTYVDSQVSGISEFSDSVFRIQDNSDATKEIAFEASAIATATTRTITMPNSNVDLGLIATAIQSSEKGASNGVATLDSGGKIPASQLPNSVMEFKGVWDASTNTPTLADGVGNAGDVYRVNVAGTQNLGSGSITFAVGDWVVYNGTIWEKSINSNSVDSVNGFTGVVVLDTDDISEGATNLYFTDERAQDAVGNILTDTTTINLTYNDGANTITADVQANSLTNTEINASAAIAYSKLAALTTNRALQSDGSGIVSVSSVTNTELGYLSGVTSAIQTQLDGKSTGFTTVSISSDVSLTANTINLVNTSAARILTLPSALNNLRLYIKDITGSSETNNITINPLSGTIDGASSLIINSNYGSAHLVSDGVNWFIL